MISSLLIRAALCFLLCIESITASNVGDDFPIKQIVSIAAGSFISQNSWQVLVEYDNGGIVLSNGTGIAVDRTCKLSLCTFENGKFSIVWTNPDAFVNTSVPVAGFKISRTAWCCGIFDSSRVTKLVTFDVNRVKVYSFRQNRAPSFTVLKSPPVWIDKAIACDLDNDGKDEIVTLEFPALSDTNKFCGDYHVGIYKIQDKELVQIWRGLDGIGANVGVPPEPAFVSKCRIEGYEGELPVVLNSQLRSKTTSNTKDSKFAVIFKNKGGFELGYPFEQKVPGKSKFQPTDGQIFNNGKRIISFGTLNDVSNDSMLSYHFSEFLNGEWIKLKQSAAGQLWIMQEKKV
jgi:hypothetical protein